MQPRADEDDWYGIGEPVADFNRESVLIDDDFRFRNFGQAEPEGDIEVELTLMQFVRLTIAGWIHELAMIVAPLV